MVLKVMVMDKLDTGNKEVTMEEVTMEEICMDKETTPQTHTTVGQPTDKVKLIVVAAVTSKEATVQTHTTVDQTTDKVNTMVVAVTSKEVMDQ